MSREEALKLAVELEGWASRHDALARQAPSRGPQLLHERIAASNRDAAVNYRILAQVTPSEPKKP